MKHTFLVQGLGFWGGATSLKKAAENALHSGGASKGNKEEVIVDLVIGDDNARIINNGMNIQMLSHCIVERIGKGFKLGQLTKLTDEKVTNETQPTPGHENTRQVRQG